MSTLLRKKFERGGWGSSGACAAPAEVRCGLCGGVLEAGETYFFLEGEKICEACLERYARRRFAHRLRRVGYWEGGEEI